MKKIILTLALVVGLTVISNAQTNAASPTGGTSGTAAKPKPVIEIAKPDATPAPAPAAGTSATTTTKKTNKKTCCKKKGSACCKPKTQAIREY